MIMIISGIEYKSIHHKTTILIRGKEARRSVVCQTSFAEMNKHERRLRRPLPPLSRARN